MQRSSLGDEQALWVCRLAPSVAHKVWAWQWEHWWKGGKPKTYCLCLLAAGLVLQGAECLNPRWGGGDTMVLTYLCTPAQNSPLLVFIKPQKPASPLKLSPHLSLCLCHWLGCPWLLWCRKHISTWVVLCTHKCGTGVVKGCACLNLKTTGAAGHSCALSADSDKEGVMFLILECEKTLYQQGHERENCTAASPAFLPAMINEHRPSAAWP